MAFLSGKQAFLQILKQEGVEVMFGNPGTTELPLMDGLAREPEHPLHPGAAGGGGHRHGRRLRAGERQARRGQRAHLARPRQRDGHALRRDEGRVAAAPHRGPARSGDEPHRAHPLVGAAAGGAALGQVVARDHAPRGPAARGAPRRQDRARPSDGARVHLAARRRAERRARARPARADAHRAAHRGDKAADGGRRRSPRQGQASHPDRGRRHRPRRCAERDGGGRRAAGRARLHRVHARPPAPSPSRIRSTRGRSRGSAGRSARS